ncbi:zinc finger protein 93 [Drosophila tropicalis]|uniref:zinc finger protein 93 n=1 Tax=Drosophila tropicalis TaxID=46794 RepID=UPI0035ABE8D5
MNMDKKLQKCLHCTVVNPKLKYLEIFKGLGAEIGLQQLLANHFQFEVTEDSKKSQLLCEECVNSLIRFFDIDELERQQNADRPKTQPTEAPSEVDVEKTIIDESCIYDLIFKSDDVAPSDEEEVKEETDVPSKSEEVRIEEVIVDDRVTVIRLPNDEEAEEVDLETEQEDEHDLKEDSNVVIINFVEIKEKDDIVDLYGYLATAVKTNFETLSFEWSTRCKHCSLPCTNYQQLLNHMVKKHKGHSFDCPIDDCLTKGLQNKQFLAMHLVTHHGPVAEIPIYGSCPECKLTFSNILQYNKHSCSHVIKKKRGMQLYCEMCSIEFPSWKRFNFHNQFHLERHRPRACFVCNYVDNNIAELFQHLQYAHEPDNTFFCNLCDRTFRDEAVYLEHNKCHSNANSNTYTCGECFNTFDTRSRFNGHMRSMHGTFISCEICSREFASEATYNVHMKKHLIIERDVHICRNCGQLSENENRMLQHIEIESTNCHNAEIYTELLRNAYICEMCSSYFREKTDLHKHRQSGVHNNGIFWCQPCDKEFTDMKIYRHHLRNFQQLKTDTEHRKLEICLYYMCDQMDCFESYTHWNSLYTHKRRTHKNVMTPAKVKDDQQAPTTSKLIGSEKKTQWQCQFCDKECRSKMSLSVHVARSHNNDNVICSICNASYKNQEALDKHHAYWHEPIECPKCFKIVKNRRNYDTHENVVHSNNKRYTCEICKKGFYHNSEMKAHQRLHTQLFSCKHCSFTTRKKTSLSVHVMGQHLKRFAFDCKLCMKRFGRRQGLTAHMQRVHSTKHICQEYITDGCNRSFPSTLALSQHVKKVHKGTIFLHDEDDEEEELELELEDEVGPSSSKKRCFQINDTEIEFIDESAYDSHEFLDTDEMQNAK